VASLWPAAGVIAGGLAILSPRERPFLLVGAFLVVLAANYFYPFPKAETLTLAVAILIEGFAFISIYRIGRLPLTLGSPRQVGALILAGAVASAVSGLFAVPTLAVARGDAALQFADWSPWFMAHFIGIIAAAPPFIAANLPARHRIVSAEAVLAIILGSAVSAIIFLSPPDRLPGQHIPVTLVFPFVLWCGARCSPLANAILACIVSLIIMYSVPHGLGPFSSLGWAFPRRIMTVQNLTLVISAGSLFLSILFAERRERETQLARALEAQKSLLYEVNHRVKNSLQLVTSVLVIEAAQLKDPDARNALRTAQSRIDIIAGLHRRLYSNERHAEVDLGEALYEVAESVLRAAGRKDVTLVANIEAGVLADVGIATPISLAVAEIVTNSVKHAYPDRGGPIHLEFAEIEGALRLAIRDEGPGLPERDSGDAVRSMGMKIIIDLFRQVDGVVHQGTEVGGASYLIRIPRRATDLEV
jgi:two-component sensor histidine kinase/integral membrane sensor domain MASE1